MASSWRESIAVISGPAPLHAVVHAGSGVEPPRWGLVFCDPFAEEKKCAHRVLVEAARAFSAAGVLCVRFDYRGTGDSPGDFAAVTPEDWMEDIAAAVAYTRQEHRVDVLGLLGLRLGATLALRVAEANDAVDFLVLWEPILNGKQYLAENLRRSMIKAMLTDEKRFEAARVREAFAQQSLFDFDGYPITAEMREQIEHIDLLSTPPEFNGPTLIVNITPKEQPAEPFVRLGAYLNATVIAVRQEPFWARIGLIEARPIVEATEIWLAEQQAAWMAKQMMANEEEQVPLGEEEEEEGPSSAELS